VILQPDEFAAWLDPANRIASFTERLDPAGAFVMSAAKGAKAAA
jgi:hypothetical protein